MFVVATDQETAAFGPGQRNSWGVVFGSVGYPSAVVKKAYPYYLKVMWLRTNANATALKFQTTKSDFDWQVTGMTGAIHLLEGTTHGGADPLPGQNGDLGRNKNWTAIPFAGFADPDTASYDVLIQSETEGTFVAVADDRNAIGPKCAVRGGGGSGGGSVALPDWAPPNSQVCRLYPSLAQPVAWSTDPKGKVSWLGGRSHF